MNHWLTIVGMAGFVLLFLYFSSWLSSTETAITNLSNRRLAILKQRNVKNIGYLLELKKRLTRTLITLLIANNVVNILLSSVTALIANQLFHAAGVSLAIGFVTFLLILFGEIVPKSAALLRGETIIQRRAGLLFFLTRLLTPLALLFRWLSGAVLRAAGISSPKHPPFISEESILSMAALAESEGVVKSVEKEIIEHVFVFGKRKAREVMVPMNRVFTVHERERLSDVGSVLYRKGFSRIPAVDDEGSVRGILYVKDLACPDRHMTVQGRMRKPFFTDGEQDITEIFHQMRKNRIHLSVVNTAHGDPVGIITMEDILEELVGDLEDEYDREHIPMHSK